MRKKFIAGKAVMSTGKIILAEDPAILEHQDSVSCVRVRVA